MDKEKNLLLIIDYIFKELDYKYRDNYKIYITKDNENFLDYNILDILNEEKCFDIGINVQGDNVEYLYLYSINTLKLFEYKRKILGKYQKSIINNKTLENIARFIGDSGNAQSVIEVLKECRVPDYLIIYPNTKWRMIYDIFKILSTSIYKKGHKLLFSIIEEFLNPIRFSSIEAGIDEQKYFSEYLSFDGYIIEKGKVKELEENKDMYDIYYENKEGKVINDNQFENIKEMLNNEDYKQIIIKKKKNGDLYLAEGILDFIGDENKFVELRKKFPNSKINTDNYKGKTNKYEVIEKIKLDNSDNNI